MSSTRSAVPVCPNIMLAPSALIRAGPVWPQQHCATPQAAAGPSWAPQCPTPCSATGQLTCQPSQRDQALVPGPPAKYPISHRRWQVLDKSREVISPAPAVKEGGRGMQTVPDRSFGEGLPFSLVSWEDPGGFAPWRGQGSGPPSNVSGLLAACIREGVPKYIPELQLAICVRRLWAYMGKWACWVHAICSPAQGGPPEAKKSLPYIRISFNVLPEPPLYIQAGDAACSQLRDMLGNICASRL